MSRPEDGNVSLPAPGRVDASLGEFWIGDPWTIFAEENLSCFERNRLFLGSGRGAFFDVSRVSGADDDGDGRSVVAADLDHDGRVDLLVRQVGGGPLRAYANRMDAGHQLTVTLRGTRSNHLGIGARAIAHVNGATRVQECFPQNTFRAQAPTTIRFGLGTATRIDRLEILWPSGLDQVIEDLEADRHVAITEGDDDVVDVVPGRVLPPAQRTR